MINNPPRNIHTDYVASDVFKPKDANALAASVQYDFVITKERVDEYREKHENTQEDWMDVGSLLWEDYETTPDYTCGGRTAIHILINFHTTIEDRFNFGGGLTSLASNIQEVHIHSLSSYRATGTSLNIFYHTHGTENYVLFDEAGGSLFRSKSLHVGSFMLWDNGEGYPQWHNNGGYPFIYENCIEGPVPTGASGEPDVIVEQKYWMTNASGRRSGGGGGVGGTCVITDFDIFDDGVDTVHSSVFSGLYTVINAGNTRVLHNGATEFSTIEDDTKGPISGNGWSYADSGHRWYNEYPWFRFNPDENVLDIYTWFAYKGVEYDSGVYKSKWYVNNRWTIGGGFDFGIMANELQEGIVYEVRIHIVSLPPSDPHTWHNAVEPHVPFNEWASPISEKVTPGVKDSESLGQDITLQILFTGEFSGQCAPWGSPPGTSSSNPYIKPSFKQPAAISDNNDCSTYSVRTSGRIYDIIAEATVQFVLLGNRAYIMSY